MMNKHSKNALELKLKSPFIIISLFAKQLQSKQHCFSVLKKYICLDEQYHTPISIGLVLGRCSPAQHSF